MEFVRSWLQRAGIYYGWFVVLGCFLLSFLTFGTIYSYTVFFGPIIHAFDASHANTSVIFAIQSLVTFGVAALLGFAIDRYGTRQLLTVAAVLLGLGLVGASLSGSLSAVVFTYSIVASAGMSITYVVGYTTPSRWFDRREGLATGIAISGTGVGILLGPPSTNALIQWVGWQRTYLVLAIVFVTVIVGCRIVLADRPSDLGLDVPGRIEIASGSGNGSVRTFRTQVADVVAMVRTRLFGLIFLAILLSFVPYYAVLVYLVEFTESVGITRGIGVLAVSTVGGFNIVAKILAGGIADRFGVIRTLTGCVLLMCVATVLFVTMPTPLSVLLLAGFFGVGSGGIAALIPPLLTTGFGTTDLSTLFGVVSVTFAITGVTVPLLVGLGFDIFGSFAIPFLAAAGVGVFALLALSGIYIVRERGQQMTEAA